jgi:hypothetical protein
MYLKVSDEMFFRITELNIIFDNPDSVTEVVSAVLVNNLNNFYRLVRMLSDGRYHLKY